MSEITKAHKARIAIQTFKTTADAMALRGYYRPSGRSGQTLEEALKNLSPEIYGTMNDPRVVELKGLEYVIDRLPCGIEECTRIILTAQEDFEDTSFEKIIPPKRRRVSFRMSEKEICFVITRGLSEIYDVLTHLTFLNIEAHKIRAQMHDRGGEFSPEWRALDKWIRQEKPPTGPKLDQAIWNLSIILGRTYQETKATYEYLEDARKQDACNKGLFNIIYHLGQRVYEEELDKDNILLIYFTPTLREMIGQHRYARLWAHDIKRRIFDSGLHQRPLHIISANLHSIVNVLYGYGALKKKNARLEDKDIFDLFTQIREHESAILKFAESHGYSELPDRSGTHIDCQLIDTAMLAGAGFHPQLNFNPKVIKQEKPVILVMDYAFGTQAFEVMDELLEPLVEKDREITFDIRSISIMGKAGILPGQKGDIMLATAHVLEGMPHNYAFENDLKPEDFDAQTTVYVGPMVTVLGTSLQNRDVLERFQTTSWRAVGLEMEGGHYQRAINAAIIRRHIQPNVKVRYAYYASDNPLISGQTLASGSMGQEGIRPTYMISKIILEKILNDSR